MANPRTHYDELGVPKGARPLDIQRAYNKYRKEADRDTAIPDAQRDKRVQAAYDTLSDPDKREAYDAALARPRASAGGERTGSGKGVLVLAGLGVAVAVAGAGYFLMNRGNPPPADPGTRAAGELTRRASLAVNRVDSTGLSGKAVPLGIAFAIGEGTAVTACNGISPTSILTLSVSPQPVSARLAYVDDKLGICKLAASGIGGSPLPLAAEDPKPGDNVYMTQVDAAGVVSLTKAQVTRVAPSSRGGTVVETTVSVAPEQSGGPVLDERGRVIGAALPAEVIRLTPEWASRTKQLEAPPPAAADATATPATATPATTAPATAPPAAQAPTPPASPEKSARKSPSSMTPQELEEDRRKRLEDALNKNIQYK
jgi:hypothetical protein